MGSFFCFFSDPGLSLLDLIGRYKNEICSKLHKLYLEGFCGGVLLFIFPCQYICLVSYRRYKKCITSSSSEWCRQILSGKAQEGLFGVGEIREYVFVCRRQFSFLHGKEKSDTCECVLTPACAWMEAAGSTLFQSVPSLTFFFLLCVLHRRTCFPIKPNRWQQMFIEHSPYGILGCFSASETRKLFALGFYLIWSRH